ncbi:LOW QUALITY PROTEIN: complement C4-B [Thalassophryne amazonica]|uniref:LOW QUALITY PROTEIN: complement C4-B n=1 Tax=Thalassophryne amazonica TaxID=390379 RepID=UPI001470C7B7|nr:LOW QUALITY PROTEIN: complement C4-B [Thalassophryne amazonica]
MMSHICLILLLMLTLDSVSSNNRFFISAPRVFHVGVKEKVLVQVEGIHLNNVINIYLEHESTTTLMSVKTTATCAEMGSIKTVELMVDKEKMSQLASPKNAPLYLVLVAESPSFPKRYSTRVLVSKHRGYIFIQTDQPIYTLVTDSEVQDLHTGPCTGGLTNEMCSISIFNAAGNRVMKSIKTNPDGILKGVFTIPDVSKTGTWKIVAHFEGDNKNSAFREFKVQKFVLPSFDVTINMEQRYILLDAEELKFIVTAMYSHGENINGAYHCRIGVLTNGTIGGQEKELVFIKGLELTGSVHDGNGAVSLKTAVLKRQLKTEMNETLSDLQQRGVQLYLGVFVTNIQNGELQEADVSLPIISHRYTIDLSRTRAYFLPGFPLSVVAIVRLPDGSAASLVSVKIDVPSSSEKSKEDTTDQQGAVFAEFNILSSDDFTLEVSVGDLKERKVIRRTSSQSGNYLYLEVSNRMVSVGSSLPVTYHINGPENGFLYYLVLSRGSIIKQGSLALGRSLKDNLFITADMVPSFRLIGYYYSNGGDIIADSVWIDVKDECETQVTVSKDKSHSKPGKRTEIEFNIQSPDATVTLLAVDKAIYALNFHNRLSPKQVFSFMQSYDLGCSYGGGSDSASTLNDAGLSFVTQSSSAWTKHFGCKSPSTRQKRAVDLHQEMLKLKLNFTGDEYLQDCCVRGFSIIPMRLTCQERAQRVFRVKADPKCKQAFLKCCLEGENLRQKKQREDAQKGYGRTASILDIEEFFLDTTAQYIRRYFPPSFAFEEFKVNGKKGPFKHSLALPDSITTWEIQVITLSPTTGFCVVEPFTIRAFQDIFVSLRLPYSVKKYEQLTISPVIYNYGDESRQLAVHMEQTAGLCSPGSATSSAFVNITVEPRSSQFVSFPAVPMVAHSIPIKIRVYDIENEMGIDAVEKTLNVLTEGAEVRTEKTWMLKLDGRSSQSFTIDGTLPENIVPESDSNMFLSMEGVGFGQSHAKNLLSPQKVASLIVLPTGCLEQTMVRLAPTALSLRYLDLSEQWFELPPGARDKAMDNIESGYIRILGYQNKKDGSYSAWSSVPSSNWVTALVVKVLSLVAERQTAALGQQGRTSQIVPQDKISHSVQYLLSVQNADGSFSDSHPVLHRGMLKGKDDQSAMTAFITLALKRALPFLKEDMRNNTEASISRSTTYLLSHFEELQNHYAVAITAYCLAVCLPHKTDSSAAWTKLQSMATKVENDCYKWAANPGTAHKERADAITVETTAYALLTAVAHEQFEWADKTACWLITQENYFGGFKSSQDTIMALEALSEYELRKSSGPITNVMAEFSVPGRTEVVRMSVGKDDKVETELKKLKGNNIEMKLTGEGEAKMKTVKVYHLLDVKDSCDKLSINVTVEGKVKYTAKIIETYDYYTEEYDDTDETEVQMPQLASPNKNDKAADDPNLENTVSYRVCVSHSLSQNLTGMAIADITLLSGFDAKIEDLEELKKPPEQYISHYEVSYGRVLFYFNELFEQKECINFDAIQRVPVGLLHPAQAVFYDYYEPSRKCTIFYSAPQRSKMVSKLCSEDVCQCAERPCYKEQTTFKSERGGVIRKNDREQHACFFPLVEYAYVVQVLSDSMKSNFALYTTKVTDVLKTNADKHVRENSVRVFAKRRQCKGQLEAGKEYLIMGKDGSTTDSSGEMQYLLESNTWVEKKPLTEECRKTTFIIACREFNEFISEYKRDGCRL